MNKDVDGSSISVTQAAETTGILWFEDPDVYEQEKETLEEKQRRISVSFLDISEAHTTDGDAVANTDDLIAKGSDSVTSPLLRHNAAFYCQAWFYVVFVRKH